jgi:hypothetical protein
MGVKLGDGDYRSQTAAEYAGKIALPRFLDELAKKEGAVSVAHLARRRASLGSLSS